MRKLGSIEKIEDFILAIACGADVNGTYRGSPLVELYFVEAMRHFECRPNRGANVGTEKLRAIIAAGADISPLFQSPYEAYEYGNLVRLITRHMELLETVLCSEQAREKVVANAIYTKDLEELRDVLRRVDNLIDTM